MHPVAIIYPHGSGGRFLGVFVQALNQSVELKLSNSGHGNSDIEYLRPDTSSLPVDPFAEFNIPLEHIDQYVDWLKTAWDKHQQSNPCKIVHTDLMHPDILYKAIPDLRILRITAEPEDVWTISWNWTIKNLYKQGLAEHRANMLDCIKKYYYQENLNIDMLDSASHNDFILWATIQTVPWKDHLTWYKNNIFPPEYQQYVYEIPWKKIRSGEFAEQIADIAEFLDIDMSGDSGAERKANATAIVDQWVSNQIDPPKLNLDYYRLV